NDFGDQQQHAADQPQPAWIDTVQHQPSILGTPGRLGGAPFEAVVCWPLRAGAFGLLSPPSTSLASSPMPPSVPISWVASTGNRMVLAFGEVANLPIASTYFCAIK